MISFRFSTFVVPTTGAVTFVSDHATATCAIVMPFRFASSSTRFTISGEPGPTYAWTQLRAGRQERATPGCAEDPPVSLTAARRARFGWRSGERAASEGRPRDAADAEHLVRAFSVRSAGKAEAGRRTSMEGNISRSSSRYSRL